MIAHHSALRVDTITHTHRADSPRPPYNLTAALKTLRICLGVQIMRSAGLYHVYEGIDYGIVWPLLKAAEWAPTPSIRQWISKLLSAWPLEGVMVSQRNSLKLTALGPPSRKTLFRSALEPPRQGFHN
jgi:hypothetical protein